MSDASNPNEVYPTTLNVKAANKVTVERIGKAKQVKTVAEIGVYRGHTSVAIAKILAKRKGELHLFDYEDAVKEVAPKVAATGCSVVQHGNARMLMDSYNWSLMEVMRTHEKPIYDYVFLDGAHTWHHDALAFFLADRLLKPGGFIDFDDYNWVMEKSKAVGPQAAKHFPAAQLKVPHVKLVVELLVRREGRYDEVVKDKIFRKVK